MGFWLSVDAWAGGCVALECSEGLLVYQLKVVESFGHGVRCFLDAVGRIVS